MRRGFLAVVLTVVADVTVVGAQGFEVMPFTGYRFGGDLFELATGHVLDTDGAPAVGVVLDVPLYGGLQVEGLFTHQRARMTTTNLSGDQFRWDVTVDHWQAGGLQEFRRDRVRPFLTGLVGLTRYAVEGDSELRFVAGAGGGVKLFPAPHLGIRLDGRLTATFIDVGGRAVACGAGPCFVALDLSLAWQTEFSAGVVFRFK